MENYKDELAKLTNEMNRKIATESATPEENKLKKSLAGFSKQHIARVV